MKCLIVGILVFAIGVAACAFPHRAFFHPPVAVTLGDLGRTFLLVELVEGGTMLRIGRAINRWLDVVAAVTPQALFSLEMRVLLLRDFGPLSAALDMAPGGFCLTAGLFLGPVRIDWGRTIGREERRWGMVTASPEQHFSLLLGLERGEERISFLGGIRLFPASGSWGGSLLFRERRLTVALGGYF